MGANEDIPTPTTQNPPQYRRTVTETEGVVNGTDPNKRDPGGDITFQVDPNGNTMDSFAHRRLMAWVALISILGLTLLVIFHINPDKVGAYDALFGWVYGTLSAIILSYMGVTAFSYSTWLKNNKKQP
jgi:hypothetical protein